ncbi:hypothetical protein DIURU_003708 [Diutina rugosa]|uniref:Uncharacterized protein n=1 Tax=Diutina rugosa TaxID=5481 RepID=A0A642UK93_DIURU|nr:uncharacterized protein DIURU_003708 [Diutina rugosa]KAA8900596.1 hypothetical protein DIURU_003708 [Diutina rugosa]
MQLKNIAIVAIITLTAAAPVANADALHFSDDRRPGSVPGHGLVDVATGKQNPLAYAFNLAYKAVKETVEGVVKIATVDPDVELPELRIDN